MADYTKVFRSIWRDRDFIALPASAQRTYMLLMTQPNINSAGVLTLAESRWAGFAPDTTADDIRDDLAILAASNFVIIDDETDELMVRTLIVHDELYKQRNGPRSIEIAMSEVLSDKIADVIVTVAAGVELTLEPRVKQADAKGTATVEPLPIPVPIPHPVPLPLVAVAKAPTEKTTRFDEFYEPYPKHEGRGAAERAYAKALKVASHETIMAGLERNLAYLRHKHSEGFCVQPARWLNEKRWNDEPPRTTARPSTTAGHRSSALARVAEIQAQHQAIEAVAR